jgi:hypothetical protein
MTTTTVTTPTVQDFAALVEADTQADLKRRFPDTYPSGIWDTEVATVTPGRVYTKVDIGTSGRYMVENATGIIYGIKGYGKVHKGHSYGTLATIGDWFWGRYTAELKPARRPAALADNRMTRAEKIEALCAAGLAETKYEAIEQLEDMGEDEDDE